jgi:hypothetical protein
VKKESVAKDKLLIVIGAIVILHMVGWVFFIRFANKHKPQEVPVVPAPAPAPAKN